jgi:hypothetical protein
MNDRFGEVVTALGHQLRLLYLGTGRWRNDFLDEMSDRKWPEAEVQFRPPWGQPVVATRVQFVHVVHSAVGDENPSTLADSRVSAMARGSIGLPALGSMPVAGRSHGGWHKITASMAK